MFGSILHDRLTYINLKYFFLSILHYLRDFHVNLHMIIDLDRLETISTYMCVIWEILMWIPNAKPCKFGFVFQTQIIVLTKITILSNSDF